MYKNGIYDTIVLKMAKEDSDYWLMGSFVATPEDELTEYWNRARDGLSRQNMEDQRSVAAPDWFHDHFLHNYQDVPWLEKLAKHTLERGHMTPHPQFEFGASVVSRGRVLLVGDAAHMASPRTAVGAHTAVMDAIALSEAFEGVQTPRDIDEAIKMYDRGGVERAQALYSRSRQVSQQFLPEEGLSAISPNLQVQQQARQVDQ